MDITSNCICEIYCLALDWFDLNTVPKLSSKEKKSWLSQDSNPGLLGRKQECFLCATQPPSASLDITNGKVGNSLERDLQVWGTFPDSPCCHVAAWWGRSSCPDWRTWSGSTRASTVAPSGAAAWSIQSGKYNERQLSLLWRNLSKHHWKFMRRYNIVPSFLNHNGSNLFAMEAV